MRDETASNEEINIKYHSVFSLIFLDVEAWDIKAKFKGSRAQRILDLKI